MLQTGVALSLQWRRKAKLCAPFCQALRLERTRLGPTPRSEPVVPTWVTVAWRDAATGQGGRETCLVPLSRPISTVVSCAQLTVAQNLGGFSVRAADHLVSDLRAQHQNGARSQAAVAARTLQFMDATGLKPTSGARRIYPGSRSANAVPETDHGIGWYDPGTRTYLYTDEPYNGSVESVAQAREAWVERHEWAMLKPTWRGMHRPGDDRALCHGTSGL